MTSAINPSFPVTGTPTTDSVRSNFATAASEITALQAASGGGPFLPLNGSSSMTGPLTLAGDATSSLQPVTLEQLNAAVVGSPFLSLAGGGTVAGVVAFTGTMALAGPTTATGPLAYTATGGTTVRSAQDRAADIVNVKETGAVANGQSAILTVSVAVGSNVMTVGMPVAWAATTAYAKGSVVTNNGGAYTCVIAGTSASSGGPITGTGNGAPVTDGSVGWMYLGPAASEALACLLVAMLGRCFRLTGRMWRLGGIHGGIPRLPTLAM